ncbi:NAD-dependent succinate-semialdehyde dehydrogenase [Flaviflexus salsibiostraticola]|uniref:NAD-dependent succinate-semialdehyde dehydrogenase n=1 Tax=Flaviflexus salsibiostraticola TaxID=1282737 RepID=A0A3Q8WUH3_9ACTO|nr:NAD-dependent succinate-semialdehyde dehydrogenase [Flaviflexus salsibiostraticola]AZN30603.1 NAD-dependent succinate-semialdehyde dehydrogenase [Flaviflexus salsibiostraticola]
MPLTPPIDAATIDSLIGRMPTSSFINGDFIGGEKDLSVENPATGEEIIAIASANAAAVGMDALDAACATAADWAATTPRHRSEILRRAYELCHERADDLALTMTMEMGKPLAEAYGEVNYGAEFLRWFSEEAVRTTGRFRPAPAVPDQDVLVYSQPVGPSLLITPWNFPFSMGTRKIGPALAAGCTVVLKPASLTPLSSLLLMEILRDAGVPPGVVNCVVTKESSTFSRTLMEDPRLRKISFTGSTPVGRTLLSQASRHVLRSSMELGGNAPFLVLESADIDKTVAAAMAGKFRNNGEACTAANRIYVHTNIAERFTAAFTAKVEALVLGNGLHEGTTLGPLIDNDAVTKCQELVDDATAKGAEVLLGGQVEDGPGHFYPATVLSNVPRDARVNREEIFGPVAPIIICDTVDDMVEAANDTEFGLMSYVCGQDIDEVRDVVGRIESGMVAVNVGVASDPSAPFGGVKESGIGREGSHEGLAEYLELKYVRMG